MNPNDTGCVHEAFHLPDGRMLAMGKLFRALLITTAATGAFAVALTVIRKRHETAAAPAPASPLEAPREVDADAMPAGERDALLDELAAQL